MRVLFTSFVLPSNYLHQVPLAWALRAAGHEVQVAAPANVAELVGRSGLTSVTVGESYDLKAGLAEANRQIRERTGKPMSGDLVAQLDPEELRWFRETAFSPHVLAAEAAAGDLNGFVRWWRPDLIVSDPLVYAAPLAAAAGGGVPLVRNLTGPDIARKVGFPGLTDVGDADVRATWPADLVELYERHGVEPAVDFAVRVVDHTPASMQIPGIPNRVQARFVPYNGTGVLPKWVLEPRERPRVCVTWGTLTTTTSGTENFLAPTVVEALADLDVEVVVAVKKSDRELMGEPGGRVRIVEELPLSLLLPTCDALVSQGGSGAVLTAAALGVPQLALPLVSDHTMIAALLAGTGAGIDLRPADADPEAIRDAVRTLVHDPKPRDAAGALAEEIAAAPAPAQIVSVLEDLV
ncbi:UDP:flavonoid glycosyltransferase YjiC (YdhE family) [Catenulispora sp. MAP5-51]|uniref:nucleotide disphospho-sugar-binding domain-containing protein n=1 Tax=Catenulispora sp. MAP5-51 TaxID=3156298 RepID=UPI0035147CEC